MPSSLKDMVQSVDWGKVFSGKDARNAAIGSALGGLMMGGAGFMAERDPEESRLAPVGDALAGALLGGVAGYGIPKGLAMFRDAGSLAPDGDTLRYHYGTRALVGGAAGAGLAGLSIRRTLRNVAESLRPSDAQRAAGEQRALAALSKAVRENKSLSLIDRLHRQYMAMSTDTAAVRNFVDGMKRERLQMLREGNVARARALARRIARFTRARNEATRGYSSFGALLGEVGRQGGAIRSRSLLGRILGVADESAGALGGAAEGATKASKGVWRRLGRILTAPVRGLSASPRHYHNGALFHGYGPQLTSARSAGLRMLKRTGKWGLGGAAAAMLLHKLLGPDPSSNFKK